MTVPTFEKFYSEWVEEGRTLVHSLRKMLETIPTDIRLSSLVQCCYYHYTKFVDAKIQAGQEDAYYVAAGMGESPLEAGFMWMGGWRPTAAFVLVYSLMGLQIENDVHKLMEGIHVPSMAALSAKQLSRLNSLQQLTQLAEDGLSKRLALLQMLVADQEMARATTAEPPPSESFDLSELREAMEPKLAGLRDLLVEAEVVRLHTLREILTLLTPVQAAQYTVAAFEMASALHKLGKSDSDAHSGSLYSSPLGQGVVNIRETASQGKVGQLQEVLKMGVDPSEPDYDSRTPLHVAASRGHTECVALLVKEGAKVNQKDDFGLTPLLEALKGGHDAVAQILINSGAIPHLQEAGTEICKAAASGDMGYVKRLVRHGVDPNVVDYSYRTPLHVVAAKGAAEDAEFLVHVGADVLARDRHGYTPLDDARQSDNEATLKVLEDEVARRQLVLDQSSGSFEDQGDSMEGSVTSRLVANAQD